MLALAWFFVILLGLLHAATVTRFSSYPANSAASAVFGAGNEGVSMQFKKMAAVVSSTLAMSAGAHAQDAVQWRVEDGGNGHWYAYEGPQSRNWFQSRDHAIGRGAYLATVTSLEEKNFLCETVLQDLAGSGFGGNAFLGGYQELTDPEPAGFRWVTGEAFDYAAFGPGNPSNSGDFNPEGEDAIAMYGPAGNSGGQGGYGCNWNDVGLLSTNYGLLLEWSADCNDDGVVDYGQILDGTFADANADGVPDICVPLIVPAQFATIQAAVDAAVDGSVIRVDPGSYAPFDMGDKLLVVESTGGAAVTTINAGGLATSAVRFGPNSTFASTVRGFTIRTGSGTAFPNNPSLRAGGGVYIWSNLAKHGGAAATIEDCVFIGATDGCGYGAGIWTRDANIAVRRCSFSGLSAEHHGPAISLDPVPTHEVPGEPGMHSIVEDSFIGTSSSYNNGGMLFGMNAAIAPTKLRITRCEFAGNTASYQAGALLGGGSTGSAGGEAIVENCVFRDNSAPQARSIAISLLGGNPSFKCTLRANAIADSAVAVRLGSGQLALGSNTFCAGTAAVAGSYTNLGGNAWICPAFVDCNANGVNDLFDVTLATSEDLDADGVPDECQPTCTDADLVADGQVNGADLAAILNAWGTNGGKQPATDINGDGLVDALDVAFVLNFWGECF